MKIQLQPGRQKTVYRVNAWNNGVRIQVDQLPASGDANCKLICTTEQNEHAKVQITGLDNGCGGVNTPLLVAIEFNGVQDIFDLNKTDGEVFLHFPK
jgi:hypothetical protein